jgi:hypothetical protein
MLSFIYLSPMCEGDRATPPKRGTPPPPPGAIPVVNWPTSPAPAEDQVPPSQGPSPLPKPQILPLSPYGESVYNKYIYRWTEVHLSQKLPQEATHTHRSVGPSAQ